MNDDWILYGTYGCHLCDQAQMLLATLPGGPLRARDVEILDDPDLEARYGVRIPVLYHPASGAELGWPFEHNDIEEFRRRVEAVS